MTAGFSRDISDPASLNEAAAALIAFAGSRRTFLFDAEMGAGKTTCISAMCRTLGARDAASSPTFSIVHEYGSDHGKIFHFDLYRVKDLRELYDIGIEEYLYRGNFCFIEWPALLRPIVEKPVEVRITFNGSQRMLSAS